MAEAIYNNNRDGMLVFFLIGCYPNRGGNPHHENPPILDQFKDNNTPYMTILIDPEYDNDYTPNYLQNPNRQKGMVSPPPPKRLSQNGYPRLEYPPSRSVPTAVLQARRGASVIEV